MKKSIISTFILFLSVSLALGQHNSNRGYFGVHCNYVKTKKAEKLNFEKPYGAYLTQILPNTAAAKNDFQPFDYVYQIGDYELSAHQDLTDVMSKFQPNDPATVYFIRKGIKQSKQVVFGNRSNQSNNNRRSNKEDPFLGVEQNHSDVPSEIVGVPVSIIDNSTALKMGLEKNDIVMNINDFPIYDWHDMRTAIDMLEVCEMIKVKYLRNGKTFTSSRPIQSLAATKDGYEDECGQSPTLTSPEIIAESNTPNIPPTLNIQMVNVPIEDAEEMEKELDIVMPVVNNLSIEELNVFPNPNQGAFNLQFNLPNNDITQVRIFNSIGKLIYSKDLGMFTGDFNDRLDLSNNPAGTYYLMVQQGDFSISKKVIIARR